MRFKSIRIRQFKGVNDAKIEMQPAGGNVFTLIGLNESGKTTILEAISKLQESAESIDVLYGEKENASAKNIYIPKHLKANFTGTISISAIASFDDGEKEKIITEIEEKTNA